MPDVIHWLIEENKLRHILLNEFEIRIAAQMRDVVHRTGHEIVNADDLMSASDEQVREMRAKKAGRTSDDGGGLFLFHVGQLNR